MVNYRCNAACRHCLYASSPSRKGSYINAETIRSVCHTLNEGRIGSVHIGGGEPFLDFDGLLAVIRGLDAAGIRLDYIETNAFWAKDPSREEKLKKLLHAGADALCISVDPFHAEYVPWEYPLELARICEKTGMEYFLWKREFLPSLRTAGGTQPQSRSDLEKALGSNYIWKTAQVYRIGMGGRAVNIEEEFCAKKPVNDLLDDQSCRRLLSTDHFHVDLEGFFIPPGCTGIRLPLNKTLAGIEEGRYPVFQALFSGGIAALFQLAGKYGFIPESEGYASKCNLCFHLRRYLAEKGDPVFDELDDDFYRESLKNY